MRRSPGSRVSRTGRDCCDAFLGLMKICRKLGLSFWDNLEDGIGVPDAPNMPPFTHIMNVRTGTA